MARELYPTPADEVPVDPIPWPDRLSQTLLRHENQCPRSAYLYVKTSGQVRSHPMDRGTLAHACAERLMLDLIQHGEESMVAKRTDPTIPTEAQEEALSMETMALVREVQRELEAAGRVHIPHEEADIARLCTFHIALGLDVNPEHVLAIERKFVLDLPSGWEVSVKQDLVSTPATGVLQVDDYKTALYAPAESEWSTFQVKTGLAAVLYGYPVDVFPCPRAAARPCKRTITVPDGQGYHPAIVGDRVPVVCSVCGGRGKIESRGEQIDVQPSRFVGRELYPRKKLRTDGKMHHVRAEFTRLELDEFVADLDQAGERVLERLESWKWPARSGSWCDQCPDESACPLPARAREFEGAIESRRQAEELWEWATRTAGRASKVQGLVKKFAKDNEISIRVGDEEWSYTTTESKSVKRKGKVADWEGLVDAVKRAAELGEAFDLDDWIQTNYSNSFKKFKVPEDQLIGEVKVDVGDGDASDAEQRERAADERWGADAPW